MKSILFGAVFLLVSSRVFAQPVPSMAPVTAQKPAIAPLDNANWRAIRVQNVRPSMIAYQLDPAHNSLPATFNIPGSLADKFRMGDDELKKVPKGPFEGLHLVGADEQKLLFVSGKDEAQIAELQELVSMLDQPLRQVVIEAQMIELSAAELKQFGLDFDAATPGAPAPTLPVQGAFQTGFVRGDFQKRINDLLANNRARVISTRPQNIVNNNSLAISLRTGPIDNTGANQYKMPPAPAEGTDTILTLTPTINGDNTITVSMNVATLPKDANSSGLMTIFNVRDGDSIALSGLPSSAFPREKTAPIPMLDKVPLLNSTPQQSVPLLSDIPINGKLFRSKKIEDERAVLLLVTARIVRDDAK